MVVSCRKGLAFLFLTLILLIVPASSHAEVVKLSDSELDQISAGSITADVPELASELSQKTSPLEGYLSLFGELPEISLTGLPSLVNINATSADAITVQVNMTVLFEAKGMNIVQTNTATIDR